MYAKRITLLILFVILAVVVVACAPAPTPVPPTAAPTAVPKPTEAPKPTAVPPTAVPPTAVPTLSAMNKLIEEAKKEAALSTIALPDDWLNYGEIKATFLKKYPFIKHTDLDPKAGSGDEINAVKANKDNKGPQAPDVIDVGFGYGPQVKDEKLCLPYKVATWDTIPAADKDPEGCWYADYYGVMSFAVNTDVVKNVPQDWNDLLKPEYKGMVAVHGDPLASNQPQQSVYAAALATGGSLDNAMPGLEFFAKLAKAGNFVPVVGGQGTLAKGETPILITWSYLGLGYKDALKGNPNVEVIVPKSAVLGGKYVQAISAYAPRPNAAKLWMEFLYSDEGQLIWLKGYGYPIRFDDLMKRGLVPADMLKKLPPQEQIKKAVFPTNAQLSAARKLVGDNWEKIVGVTVQK